MKPTKQNNWLILCVATTLQIAYFAAATTISGCSSDPNCAFCNVLTSICILCSRTYYLSSTTGLCTTDNTCQTTQIGLSTPSYACSDSCAANSEPFVQVQKQYLTVQCSGQFPCSTNIKIASGMTIRQGSSHLLYFLDGSTSGVTLLLTDSTFTAYSAQNGMPLRALSASAFSGSLKGYAVISSINNSYSTLIIWDSLGNIYILKLVTINDLASTQLSAFSSSSSNFVNIISINQPGFPNISVLATSSAAPTQIASIILNLDSLTIIHSDSLDLSAICNSLELIQGNNQLLAAQIILCSTSTTNTLVSISTDPTTYAMTYSQLCKTNSASPIISSLGTYLAILDSTSVLFSDYSTCLTGVSLSFSNTILKIIYDSSTSSLFVIQASTISRYIYNTPPDSSSLATPTTIYTISSSSSPPIFSSCVLSSNNSSASQLICSTSDGSILGIAYSPSSSEFSALLTLIDKTILLTSGIYPLKYSFELNQLIIISASSLRVIQSFSTQLQYLQAHTTTSTTTSSLPSLSLCIYSSSAAIPILPISSSVATKIEKQFKLFYQLPAGYSSSIYIPPQFTQIKLVPATAASNTLSITNTTFTLLNTTQSISLFGFRMVISDSQFLIPLSSPSVDSISNSFFSLNTVFFTGNIQSSSMLIANTTIVMIKSVTFANMTLTNSTLLDIQSCSLVIFSSVTIYNVTLLDSLSKLISVASSNKVIFINTTIIASSPFLTGSSLVSISAASSLTLQDSYLFSNYYPMTLTTVVYPQYPPIVISALGCTSTVLSNFTAVSNKFVQPLRISPTYTASTLNGLLIMTNPSTAITGFNLTLTKNSNKSPSAIFLEGASIQISNFTAAFNTQPAGNGTAFFQKAQVYMQYATFFNNTAYSGAAMYLNKTSLTQLYGCTFFNNSVSAAGGAILSAQSQIILNSTKIFSNTALIGGGIRIENGWSSYYQADSSSSVLNNIGTIFGNNVASRLQTLKIFINDQEVSTLSDELFSPLLVSQPALANGYSTQLIQSGSSIDVLVQLFDKDGRIFMYNTTQIASAPTIQLEFKQIGGLLRSFTATILGDNQISDFSISKQGFLATGLIIQGYPKANLSAYFIQDYVELIKRTKQATTSTRILSAINKITTQKTTNLAKEHLAIVHSAESNDNLVQYFQDRIPQEYCKQAVFDSIIKDLEEKNLWNNSINRQIIHGDNRNNKYGSYILQFLLDLCSTKKHKSSQDIQNFVQNQEFNLSTRSINDDNFKTSPSKRNLAEIVTILSILQSMYMQAVVIYFNFRDCEVGEIRKIVDASKNITTCEACPQNSYTLYNNQTQCNSCPSSAYSCQNSTIILKDGYWRQNRTSDEIFECDASLDSCLEYTLYSQNKICKEGYSGPLCSGCETIDEETGKRYSLSKIGGECQQCSSLDVQIVYLVVLFVLVSGYLLFCIQITITTTNSYSLAQYVRMMGFAAIYRSSQSDVSSQYVKVLVHYMQIFAVINFISVQLPSGIDMFPKYSGNPGTAVVLSTSCLFSEMGIKQVMEAKVLQSTLLPFVYCLSVIIIVLILSALKVYRFSRQFLRTTIIFILMFFQPDSVMFLLSSIGCKKLTKDSFLIADSNYQCYTDSNYKTFMYAYSFPALVFWSLSPVIILFFLYKRRHQLDLISTRQRFGYLYQEYKPQFYYFEFFRSIIKIAIVIFFTLSTQDEQFKFNCVVLLISFYLIVSNHQKPFLNYNLALTDSLTHAVILFFILLNILMISTESGSITYSVLKFLATLANGLYILVMILIILTLKLTNLESTLSAVLLLLQKKCGKCAPFLLKLHIPSVLQRKNALKRWKFLHSKMHIVMKLAMTEKFQRYNQVKEFLCNSPKFFPKKRSGDDVTISSPGRRKELVLSPCRVDSQQQSQLSGRQFDFRSREDSLSSNTDQLIFPYDSEGDRQTLRYAESQARPQSLLQHLNFIETQYLEGSSRSSHVISPMSQNSSLQINRVLSATLNKESSPLSKSLSHEEAKITATQNIQIEDIYEKNEQIQSSQVPSISSEVAK